MVDGFISYAHDDYPMLQEFKGRLDADKRTGRPNYWADSHLRGGQAWNQEIERAIARADVFVLLVSSKFIGSTYIHDVELPAINTRAVQCGGLIVPVLLRNCVWEQQLGHLQTLPSIKARLKAVANWRPHNDGYDAAHRQLLAAMQAHYPGRSGGKP